MWKPFFRLVAYPTTLFRLIYNYCRPIYLNLFRPKFYDRMSLIYSALSDTNITRVSCISTMYRDPYSLNNFFIRSFDTGDHWYFWDVWINTRRLRPIRGGVLRAHNSLGCREDCLLRLPTRQEFTYLEELTTFIIHLGCYDVAILDELSLRCLSFYNDLFYSTMEVATRHQID